MQSNISGIAPRPVISAVRFARSFYRRFRREAVFERIYQQNLWGDRESRSGTGSGLVATEKLRKGLIDVIQRFDVRTMIDAPCGDFRWASALHLETYLDRYRGLDIVPEIISRNKASWSTEKISFEAADLVKSAPPRADLILCRHLLIHLPLEDCKRVLRNFQRSGSRYLMITNQPQVERNEEILFTGSYRPVNLFLAPFHFPKPILSVEDPQGEGDQAEVTMFELSALKI